MSLPRVEDLDSLLQSKAGGDASAIKVALTRLSAEIKDRVKRASPESMDFFTSVVRSLGQLRGTAHAEARMDCLYHASQFFQENGFATQALNAAHQLERLAAQTKAEAWRRRADHLSGMIHADLGNISDSVISTTNAIFISRESGDLLGEAAGLINLGAALNYGGLFREAIPCFERAAMLSRDES